MIDCVKEWLMPGSTEGKDREKEPGGMRGGPPPSGAQMFHYYGALEPVDGGPPAMSVRKFKRKNMVIARNLRGRWNNNERDKGKLYVHKLVEAPLIGI
jgi:hypothetical protein